MGIKDWAQTQREKARDVKLAKEQGKHKIETFRDDYGRKIMRYVDPNTGYYYDEMEDHVYRKGDTKTVGEATKTAMQLMIQAAEEQRFAEKARQMSDMERDRRAAEQNRKYYMEQFKHAEAKGNAAEAAYWLDKIWQEGRELGEVEFEEDKCEPVPVLPRERKIGFFPIHWMREAIARAEASDMSITITVERDGILVTAMEAGERFDIRITSWEAMEDSEENPILPAIADAEKKLRILEDMKARVGGHG